MVLRRASCSAPARGSATKARDTDSSGTALGVVAGVVFIFISRRVIDHGRELHLGALEGADARKALLIVGIMTLHSFAEGVGVGVAFGVQETFGILIGVAIAVHNIPEGLAISLVLIPRGASTRAAAAWSIFSSLPQPLMAVPAFLFVEAFSAFLPVGLGFAAGAMLWLVVADLLPEALETTSTIDGCLHGRRFCSGHAPLRARVALTTGNPDAISVAVTTDRRCPRACVQTCKRSAEKPASRVR